MRLQISPTEYYKLRGSHKDLEITGLSDKYGEDCRVSYAPYVRTYIFEDTILKYQKEVIENITFGEKLINIIKEEQEDAKLNFGKYHVNYKLLLRWEHISGVKQEDVPESQRHFWRNINLS